METPHPATRFAPPERSAPEVLSRQAALFSEDVFFAQLLDYVPVAVAVLNLHRQIVFGNLALLRTLGRPRLNDILGKRPGEAINCRHHAEGQAGCGTTEFCRYCGAVNAILASQTDGSSVSECRILAIVNGNEEALDLRVWANRFERSGEFFTFFALLDIADEKRRLFLERIFLHDIANTITTLVGFSSIVGAPQIDEAERQAFIARIQGLSRRIADEVNAHRQLIAAEYNQLAVSLAEVHSLPFIERLRAEHDTPEITNGRLLRVDPSAEALLFHTDPTVLGRVLGNMLKNGLESSTPGETVTIGCQREGDGIRFWVHNPTYMPENIRLQVFNRSFSTKGAGRGLGTYSMKYLTEKYLRGTVRFTSSEAAGTTFMASYPLQPEGIPRPVTIETH